MTPHNEAQIGQIAKTVLMPGDPLRAKYIAEKYLDNVTLVNQVRGMYAYTGTYKGKEISIMAHGMGMPSIGIYCYELYKYYNVENIIRIGSCGAYIKELNLSDLILVTNSYTESNFALTLNNEKCTIMSATEKLNTIIEQTAKEQNISYFKGTTLCSDCFDYYMTDIKKLFDRIPKNISIIGAEMEAFALFYISHILGKNSACILSVVDSHFHNTEMTAQQRETSLTKMITLALESAIKCN